MFVNGVTTKYRRYSYATYCDLTIAIRPSVKMESIAFPSRTMQLVLKTQDQAAKVPVTIRFSIGYTVKAHSNRHQN